jgi:AraC family transcriptional regulator, transcriptional activator FtrA
MQSPKFITLLASFRFLHRYARLFYLHRELAEWTTFGKNWPMSKPHPKPYSVACIAYDHWSLFEAGIASEVFGLPRPEFLRPLYNFKVVRAESGVLRSRGGLRIGVNGGLRLLPAADLIIVPGWRDHREIPPMALIKALRAAHARGSRLMSICTGAFVLAAAGVLDGKEATTHWRYAEAFRALFPKVRLLPDVLYVDDGNVVTSAGSAAGIDACLHVVRKDYGSQIANSIARTMVTPPRRLGSQAQYIPSPVSTHDNRALSPLQDWARQNLHRPLRVSDLAKRASMSQRSLLRHFHAQTSLGPKSWLRRERVSAAQALLEQSGLSLQQIAEAVGFGSVEAIRCAFRDIVGAPPLQQRRMFIPDARSADGT